MGRGRINEITVTSQASKVTIDRALEILAAAKEADPDASVDVIIYHVIEKIPIDMDRVDEDPKVLRDTRDKILERANRR